MLDKSKLPPDLVVRRVWVPEHVSDPRRPIAYVVDRRRRLAGGAMIAVGVILALSVVVSQSAYWLAFVSLLIAWAGVPYAGGGRTGFYEIHRDGGLGRYLGRSRPPI